MLFLTSSAGKGSYLADFRNVDKGSTIIAGTYPTSSHDNSSKVQNDYHCISEQIFRLEFGLLMKDGTYYRESPNSSVQIIQDMRDVAAIFATIALLPNPPASRWARTPRALLLADMQNVVLKLNDGNTPAVATDWTSTLANRPVESPPKWQKCTGLSTVFLFQMIARKIELLNIYAELFSSWF